MFRESFKTRVSAEDLRGTETERTTEENEYDEQSVCAMDAFLVFRAFCKLSAKDISIERFPFQRTKTDLKCCGSQISPNAIQGVMFNYHSFSSP
jgi:hypothetical protein